MFRTRSMALAAAVSGLLAGSWTCAAQGSDPAALQAVVEAQQEKIASLEKALVQANRAEKEASEQLGRVRLRLDALGRNLLDGGDDRLVAAVSDQEVLRRRVSDLEAVSSRLMASVSDYLREAVAADPDARLRLETAMRELDEALGLRQKPAPVATGTTGQAKVVSIDSDSGLIVLSVGESQNVRIGTNYRLTRGSQSIGSAIVADVRRNVCGAFVEALEPGQGPVRLGDTAVLITE